MEGENTKMLVHLSHYTISQIELIILVYMRETYSVEPEFGEWRVIKLKEPFANGDFADISAALLFIPLSGSCIIIRVLQHNNKHFVSAYHVSPLTKKGI